MTDYSHNIDKILEERGKRYGDAFEQFSLAQDLKMTLSLAMANGQTYVAGYQKEAMDMICTKLSRIVVGDPSYIDNWDDIAGYASCVSKAIKQHAEETESAKS